MKVYFTTKTIVEISTNKFYQKVKLAEEQSLYQKESTNGELSWPEDFNPEVLASAHFETKEYVFAKSKSQEKAMTAKPSHYKITATSFENVKEIGNLTINTDKIKRNFSSILFYDGNTEGEIIHEVFAERNCVHGHRK